MNNFARQSGQCCYGASRASRPAAGPPDEPERSPLTTALPGWVGELSVQHGNGTDRLPFSEKWANHLQGLSINGEEFLTADSFGLQRSAVIDLVADACEFNFSFTVYPHPTSPERVQVLCWREGR